MSGGMVSAQEQGLNYSGNGQNPIVNSQTVHGKGHHKAGCKAFQANLEQLVKDGVITQEKAGQIKTFMDKRRQEKYSKNELELSLGNVSDILVNRKEVRQLIFNLFRNGLEAMNSRGKITIVRY